MNKKKKAACIIAAAVVILCAVISLAHYTRLSVMKTLYPVKYDEFVEIYCEKYILEKAFVFAVIKCESDFDKNAVSSVNAKGLMQLMPDTFAWLKPKLGESDLNEDMLFDPETSVKYGCYLYRFLIDRFENEETAVAAYHAGLGNVSKWLKSAQYSSDGVTLDDMPFPTTKAYVEKVMRTKQIYSALYGL